MNEYQSAGSKGHVSDSDLLKKSSHACQLRIHGSQILSNLAYLLLDSQESTHLLGMLVGECAIL